MEVLVSAFIERFLTTFGARSIAVAQTQYQQATGHARASWLLILRLLEQEAGTCAEPSIAHDRPTPN